MDFIIFPGGAEALRAWWPLLVQREMESERSLLMNTEPFRAQFGRDRPMSGRGKPATGSEEVRLGGVVRLAASGGGFGKS
jgi:hypothetical protein